MSEGGVLVPGSADGVALVLTEPLSFWGGSDPATGTIIDRRHPQHGKSFAGRILVMPSGRGSSSSSSVLAEAIRAGQGPSAIVLRESDAIVAVGSVVAAELYGRTCPVVVAPGPVYASLSTGDRVELSAEGSQLSLAATPPGPPASPR